MFEARVTIDTAVREGSTKKGAYDNKMKEMWRAYKEHELGDNRSFIDDLKMIHDRIKGLGDYWNPIDKKKEVATINEGIDELYGEYLKFKSTIHVLDPAYATLHKTAVQDARDAGVIQTPATSSKDTLPKPKAKPKGRPRNDPQPETEPKPKAKPKGKPKKWVAKTD